MSKGVKWVTLTPEERRMVQPTSSGSFHSSGSGSSALVKQHVCDVELPDRTTCRVTYQRDTAQWHRFQFAAPIQQRLYVTERLESSVAAVETKAQALARQAYTQAQEAEQKEMQRNLPPPGRRSPVDPSVPLLRAKTAQAQAGQYAVCVAFPSGNLMPIGRLHTKAETAVEEWEQIAQKRQEQAATAPLVVGICCRWQRRWIPAQFVVYPPNPPNRLPAATSATLPHPTPQPAAEAEPEAKAEKEKEASAAAPPAAPKKARSSRKRTKQQAGEEAASG